MGVFEHCPYTNFHDLNLDWIVKELEKLASDVQEFISINAIKYANPIKWDITSQYEKNTVVLDKDGNAYLSVQPVPAGVSLDRTEYWTNIGNFSALWESVKKAITIIDEGASTTASESRTPNTLVWVENNLLEVTKNMNAGDQYNTSSDGNCRLYTMQMLLNNLLEEIENRKTAIIDLENDLTEIFNNKTSGLINVKEFGAAGDGETNDTTAIQSAINSGGNKIVFVPSGTYMVDTITMIGNCRLIGENGSIIHATANHKDYILKASNKNNVSLENICFEGNTNDTGSGLFFEAINNLRIVNCIFKNCQNYNPIHAFNIQNGFISKNIVDGNTKGDAISINSESSNVIISENVCTNYADTGIVVAAGAHNILVCNNKLDRVYSGMSNAQDIAVADAHDVLIIGNTIKSVLVTGSACIRVYTDPNTSGTNKNITICGNIMNNSTYGIVANAGEETYLTSNAIHNVVQGVRTDGNGSIYVLNNTISCIKDDENSTIIAAENGASPIVKNNIFQNAVYGVRILTGIDGVMCNNQFNNVDLPFGNDWNNFKLIESNYNDNIATIQTAPTIPSADVSIKNPFPFNVYVEIIGTVNNIAINQTPFAGLRSCVLGPEDTISINYTGNSPRWVWLKY